VRVLSCVCDLTRQHPQVLSGEIKQPNPLLFLGGKGKRRGAAYSMMFLPFDAVLLRLECETPCLPKGFRLANIRRANGRRALLSCVCDLTRQHRAGAVWRGHQNGIGFVLKR
jgi:hypothetical protein